MPASVSVGLTDLAWSWPEIPRFQKEGLSSILVGRRFNAAASKDHQLGGLHHQYCS